MNVPIKLRVTGFALAIVWVVLMIGWAAHTTWRQVERQAQRLLNLGFKLVAAHRESLTRFLAESQKSLGYLRGLFFGALFVLVVLVGWLAIVVYRDMIQPLRLKLVESHAIIERQEK